MKYVASCSFGKDSLAMLKIIKDKKLPLDEIVFCDIKATDTMSGIFDKHRNFITEMIPKLEAYMGVPVKTVCSDLTFEKQFYTEKGPRAKHPGIYGFPMTLKAWCNDRLKMRPVDKYFKEIGEHVRYIGIAYDEPERYARLEENEKAPLYDYEITEAQAFEICEELGWKSPIYEDFTRDGCWFCPKQSLKSLRTVYEKYPHYWEILKKWQKDSAIPFRPNMTIFDLDEKFKKEKNK